MQFRQAARIAVVIAATVQAAWVALYAWMTRGCFCSEDGAPGMRAVPGAALRLADIAIEPAGYFVRLGWLPEPSGATPLPAVLLVAGINVVIWAVALMLAFGTFAGRRLRPT